MRKVKFGISLLLTGAILGSTLIGCTPKKEPEAPAPKTETPAQSGTEVKETATYPIKTDVTLKYWMELHGNATSYAKNFADLEIAKTLKEKIGVNVEYIHPATGQTRETFNILVASNDLPDIIEFNWMSFPGGPTAAIDNGVIIKLNDVIDKYSPNLKKYLASNPEINKQVKTDDGTYFVYPFIRGDKELQNTSGPFVRKDWLDELGLSVPETIEEWENMLIQFRDKKDATMPLTVIGNADGAQIVQVFEGAFGLRFDFFQENGKVKYGPAEAAYKEYLTTMAKWYKDGLLDKNFNMTDRKTQDANFLNGKAGATYGAGGGHIGTYMNSMKDKDPKFDLVATKFPVMKKGDVVRHGGTSFEFAASNGLAAITTKCKNVEVAARYLDYAYSPEGHLVYNFGVEGVSYNMVNGKPMYSDLVMKNPDGLTVAQAMTKYTRGNTNGPFVQDAGYIQQFYALQQQKDALVAWSAHEKKSTMLPPVSYTSEESSELAKIMTDISTYVNEFTVKAIMGATPISDFDKYIDQLKKMNIERAIQINEQALARYNKR